jgi:hypothetical protein
MDERTTAIVDKIAGLETTMLKIRVMTNIIMITMDRFYHVNPFHYQRNFTTHRQVAQEQEGAGILRSLGD